MKYLGCALVSIAILGVVPGTGADEKPAGKAGDTLTLQDQTTVSGAIIDITDRKVVIEVDKKLQSFPRQQVKTIGRAALEKTLASYRKKAEALEDSGTLDEWKALAAYCRTEQLVPERRQCLRQVLRLDPNQVETRVELGHAELNGSWLSEDEVEGKDKNGGKTEVRKETPIPGYAVLPRTKMSVEQRAKMERDRANRLKLADKFLAMKEEEYRGVAWSKRHKIPSKHFEVHCNSTFQIARAYSRLMELIRAELATMFTSGNQRGNLKAPVYIYCSQEEFMSTDRLGRFMGRGLGGYYLPSNQSITAFHGTFGFTGTTFSVLCHEATHYYQGLVLQDFDNIPIWLIEGLAVYFGDGSTFDPKTEKIRIGLIPRDRLAHIQEKMLLKRHTSIADLIGMTRMGKKPFTGSQYADAWALIYFLVKSGPKGERLLKDYWKIGLKNQLKREHFVDLANEHFKGIAAMEKSYVAYILQLGMPAAGKVVGDYFVSDTFQFDFKSPGDEWEFFEDSKDKKMLVGSFKPGSSAEVRIYYTNNDTWAKAQEYFDAYEKLAKLQFKDYKHDPNTDRVKSGKLEWYRVRYQDEGRKPINVSLELDGLEGLVRQPLPDPGDAEKGKDAAKETPRARAVTRFLLIQIDGVVEIECSTLLSDAGQYTDLFEKMNELFTLCFTRRW